MAGDGEGVEGVFELGATTDVVDEHQAAGLRAGGGADDGDVRTADGHHLCDEIAGLPSVTA